MPPQRPTAKDLRAREQLVEAAFKLRRIGESELADVVDFVLTPKGWTWLGRLRSADGGVELNPNLPIRMEDSARAYIKAAAEAAGDRLADVVEECLLAFIEGRFIPTQTPRNVYGAKKKMSNLNVRPNKALRSQAEARCEDLTAELGWRVSVSPMLVQWFLQRYPIPGQAGTK